MLRRAVLVTVALVLSGCTSRPDPQLFVMSPAPEAANPGESKAQPVVAVLRVRLPDYLERSQIVSRSGANALEVDDDARWAEPLDESVPRVMAENLSHYLPSARVVVPQEARGQKIPFEYLVALDAYEPDGRGSAVMRGRWHLRDTRNGKIVSEGRIDESRRMPSRDAPAVVHALNETLNEASHQIADATAGTIGR